MPSTSRISRRFIAALVAASLIPTATAMAATPRSDSAPAPAAAQIGIGEAYGPVVVAPAHSASAPKAARPHRAARHHRTGKRQ